MDPAVFQVVASFRRQAEDDDELEFEDWLDEAHQGGERKVPNPDVDTRGQFPEVTMNTALKNRSFREKALKDFQKWLESKKKKKPEPKERPEAKEKLVSTDQVESVLTKHKNELERLTGAARKRVTEYRKKPSRDVMDGKTFDSLSEAEQILFTAGHEVGEYFEKHVLKDKETHKAVMRAWRAASGDPLSQELHGLLSSMGISGSIPPDEAAEKDLAKARKKGPSNKKLRAYVEEVMTFTQAYFRHMGIEEVTVYRGVEGQVGAVKPGEAVKIKCREASSFTIDPNMAEAFGDKVLSFKVPVENIFGSFLTNPDFGSPLAKRASGGALGESEMIVLGASELAGRVKR